MTNERQADEYRDEGGGAMFEFESPATDAIRYVRYPLGSTVYVGTISRDPGDGSHWVAFKVSEDANGRLVSFRPNVPI